MNAYNMVFNIVFLFILSICKVVAIDGYVLPPNISPALTSQQLFVLRLQDFKVNMQLLLEIENNAPFLAHLIQLHCEHIAPKPIGAPALNIDKAASTQANCIELIRSVYYRPLKMDNLSGHMAHHLSAAINTKSKFNTNNIHIAMSYVRFVHNLILPGSDRVRLQEGALGTVSKQNSAFKINADIETEATKEGVVTPATVRVSPSDVRTLNVLQPIVDQARTELNAVKALQSRRDAIKKHAAAARAKADKDVNDAILQASATIGFVLENLKTYRKQVDDATIASVKLHTDVVHLLPYVEVDGEDSIRVYYKFDYHIGNDPSAAGGPAAAVIPSPRPASILYIVFKQSRATREWYAATAFPAVL